MNDSLNLTSDEKLMGGVAHIFGPFVAIIVWATQKDKSRFVKYQSLQALAFDLFIFITGGFLFFCLFAFLFLGMSWATFRVINTTSPDEFMSVFALPFMFPFASFTCITPLSLVILALRLIAGISVLNGRNYKYPIIGKWIEGFLN